MNTAQWPRGRQHHLGCLQRLVLTIVILIALVSGIMILAISIEAPLHDEMQGYFLLGSGGKIATACILQPNVENRVWVDLIQYDPHGKVVDKKMQLVFGNGVRLQAATIIYPAYMRYLVGLQSGIKLTLLEAYYLHANNEVTKQPTSIPLNGGIDAKFTQMQKNPSPVVTASLDDSFTPPVDGKTYDIYTTNSGLTYQLAAQQIKSCAINAS